MMLALAVAGSATILAAQQPAETSVPVPVIKEQVRQVLVPVVVTDKSGHYVTGLKPSDFQVLEDGAAQKIVGFSTAADPATLAAVEPAAPIPVKEGQAPAPALLRKPKSTRLPRRTYLICIDTLHSSFANFGRVREALKHFFEREHNEDSQYALITLGREIHVIKDSTRDPAQILAAVEDTKFLKVIQDSEAASMATDAQLFTYEMRDDYCRYCACLGATADNPGCPGAKARAQLFLLSAGERTWGLQQNFLHGLVDLVKATSSMPTSRTVVFLSDGFNRLPGRELYAIMDGFEPKDRSFEFNPRDTEPLLQAVLKVAVHYDVKFYTIDSRGLYTAASTPGNSFDASFSGSVPERVDFNTMTAAHENTDALFQLAHETGGLFFENSNDLLKGIQKAFADGREYYVLAYVPTNRDWDGKYRKIKVEVRGKRLSVTSKPGYWATDE